MYTYANEVVHAHGEPGRQLPAQATEGEPAFEPPEKKGDQHKNKQLQVEQSKNATNHSEK